MSAGHVAYGLSLRSPFALPGMAPARLEGPPSLDLALEAPDELEAAWSGPVGPSPWRGQLGDGQMLTIERGVDGDLRFAYGDRACFRLNPVGDRLGCAPRDATNLDWRRVLLNRILPNVSIAHGNEALHACAVETERGVLAVAAPSGTGKSTLARELMRKGRPLFADDVLILSRGSRAVEAQAATPHMNVSAGAGDSGDLGETLASLAGESWLAVHGASNGGRELAAVAILERGPGLSLDAKPLPGTPLDLAPYMLGLPDDEGRDARRFALYSDLVESVPLIQLTGGPADRPAALADALECVLSLSSSLVAGAG
ncbi:MAG: hypothetical protein QOF85_2160 [Solirubrobacterales bacterium]|jgi:hypothetical protein|nr:hypothetical protein [Solirubrobacterales bacterium]